jgi:hypothetical protein
MTNEFFDKFLKNPQISSAMKIHVPCGQTKGLTDEQTEDQMERQIEGRSDMTKLIVVFCNFSKTTTMLQTC